MRASMDVNSTVTWITPQQHTDQNPVSSFPQHDVKFRSPWVLPPQPRGHPQADGPKHDGEPHVPPMHQDQDRGLRVTYPRHQEHHPRQPRSPKSPTSTVFWDAQTCSNQTITWLASIDAGSLLDAGLSVLAKLNQSKQESECRLQLPDHRSIPRKHSYC